MKVSSVSLPESVIDMARFDPCDVVKDLLKVPLKTLYKATFEFSLWESLTICSESEE